MKINWSRVLISAVAIGILLLSCTKQKKVAEKKLARLSELKSMPWEEVVSQAKQEGQVSWYVWYFQDGFRELAAAFTEKYNIQVIIPEGQLSANLNKATAEAREKSGSIDLLALGNDRFSRYRKLFFGPLDFMPNYEQRETNISGVDSNDYGLAYWGNQTGLAYDPDRVVEADLPQTLDELQNWMQKNPLLFGFNDPNGGGSGQMFIQSIIENLLPGRTYTDTLDKSLTNWNEAWDWLKNNREYYGLTASNADSLTRLNDGEFALVPAWEDHMLNLQGQGAIDRRFKIYIPTMGMAGGGSFTAVLKNAPHPAAALLFLEWLTSAQTQSAFNKKFGSAPKNKQADDSFSAISNEMRQHSTNFLPSVYGIELKKQFVSNILSQ